MLGCVHIKSGCAAEHSLSHSFFSESTCGLAAAVVDAAIIAAAANKVNCTTRCHDTGPVLLIRWNTPVAQPRQLLIRSQMRCGCSLKKWSQDAC